MANTPNTDPRKGEQQRRQQQPGSQQIEGEREQQAGGQRSSQGSQGQGSQGQKSRQKPQGQSAQQGETGQGTRSNSSRQAGSQLDDEESSGGERLRDSDPTMRARGADETGEDEDMPSRDERSSNRNASNTPDRGKSSSH